MYKLIRTLLPVLAAMIATTVSAQSVSWKSSVQHLDGQTYRIVLEASIPAPWHMYDMGPYEGGPNATTITFTPGEGAVLEGGVEQLTRPERHYDKTFGMEIGTFARKAQFAQSVKLTAPQATVKAELAWMICNDTSCLPPDDTELTITLPAGATPAVQPAETPAKESAAAPETVPAAEIAPAQKDAAGGGSLWGLIIEAILWGFAALLTPCVFPMVPMTVSFFMKGSGSPALGRIRAGMYGFFIVALYTLPIAAIILITRLVGGDAVTADIFNWLATHWLPNILFFLVFMVFAASFFGAFEITMPSWMVNKTDSKADSKGLAGIFFMALTLVLVSFSCTGPIVGSVLIKSTAGEFWSPIVTMLAFSVAFALPFTLFAFFPSMLKKLPKSGGWLNSVKVVLGFIEVALGMKFLSVADQTYHWGLLDREIYLAVWIVTFSLLGLYLLGKIKFAHDSDMPYLGVGRLALAIVTFSLVVYLVPGMWGAPLKGLSGYLPPLHTQDFVIGQQDGSGPAPAGGEARMLLTVDGQKPKHSDFLHLPLQAGTDEILKAMGRKYTLAEYKSMIDCARSKMPHIHIGSDLIVGFPGETAELFEQSCEFVKSMHFANLHVFPFSPRKGTKAEKLPGRIPVEEMVRRVEATKPIKAACAAEFAKSLIGTELSVLFERTLANNGYEGWSSNYVKVRTRSPNSILKEIHTVKVNAGNDENILSGKLMN